jgi:hypothetical protein
LQQSLFLGHSPSSQHLLPGSHLQSVQVHPTFLIFVQVLVSQQSLPDAQVHGLHPQLDLSLGQHDPLKQHSLPEGHPHGLHLQQDSNLGQHSPPLQGLQVQLVHEHILVCSI